MKKVTRAIIPAAGWGTRFLPQTKAVPKEMLPVVDRPVIQYVVEELVASGIHEIIIVVNSAKRAIREHFGGVPKLENYLERTGKKEALAEVRRIAEMARFTFVNQIDSYGNAAPIISARGLMEEGPFLLLWGDDFIHAQPPRAAQLIAAYEKYGGSILCAVRTNKAEDKNKYAFLEGPKVDEGVLQIKNIREKPGTTYKDSELASVSGYLLTPAIVPIIDKLEPGKSGELWLVDAISKLAETEKIYGLEVKNGNYYDTGDKLGYLKTVVDLASKNPDFGAEFDDFLMKKMKSGKRS